MNKLFLGILGVGGAVVLLNKKKSASTTSKTNIKLLPFYKINSDCSKIEKQYDYASDIKFINKDNEQIKLYLQKNNSLENDDLFYITEKILNIRYPQCFNRTESYLYKFLFVHELFRICNVLVVNNLMKCSSYLELIFGEIKDKLTKLNYIVPYNGTASELDDISDGQYMMIIDQTFKNSPQFKTVESECLAFSFYIGNYSHFNGNTKQFALLDYSLSNPISKQRFNRYVELINKVKSVSK